MYSYYTCINTTWFFNSSFSVFIDPGVIGHQQAFYLAVALP